MGAIQSFSLSGAQHEDGTLSVSAHVGECTGNGRVWAHLEWKQLDNVPCESNLADWQLAALERVVEMFHTHVVMSFVTEHGEDGAHDHAF